jgi:hypothetical protein
MHDHQKVWGKHVSWMKGVDEWIDDHGKAAGSPIAGRLGRWTRDSYRRFDLDSFAFQDMVFFHSFVRRVFFDTGEAFSALDEETESMVRCYIIPLTALQETGRKLIYEAEDTRGRRAAVRVTDLRLFLFANGIGILTMGIDATHIPVSEALWINEMMRKVYPSSGRQIREGRTPCRAILRWRAAAIRWCSPRRVPTLRHARLPAPAFPAHHRSAVFHELPAARVRTRAGRANDRLYLCFDRPGFR